MKGYMGKLCDVHSGNAKSNDAAKGEVGSGEALARASPTSGIHLPNFPLEQSRDDTLRFAFDYVLAIMVTRCALAPL